MLNLLTSQILLWRAGISNFLCSNEPFPLTMTSDTNDIVTRCIAFDSTEDYLLVMSSGRDQTMLGTAFAVDKALITIYNDSNSSIFSSYLSGFTFAGDPSRIDCAFTYSATTPFFGFAMRSSADPNKHVIYILKLVYTGINFTTIKEFYYTTQGELSGMSGVGGYMMTASSNTSGYNIYTLFTLYSDGTNSQNTYDIDTFTSSARISAVAGILVDGDAMFAVALTELSSGIYTHGMSVIEHLIAGPQFYYQIYSAANMGPIEQLASDQVASYRVGSVVCYTDQSSLRTTFAFYTTQLVANSSDRKNIVFPVNADNTQCLSIYFDNDTQDLVFYLYDNDNDNFVLIDFTSFNMEETQANWRSTVAIGWDTFHFTTTPEFANTFAHISDTTYFGGGTMAMGDSTPYPWTSPYKTSFVFEFSVSTGFQDSCFAIASVTDTAIIDQSNILVDNAARQERSGFEDVLNFGSTLVTQTGDAVYTSFIYSESNLDTCWQENGSIVLNSYSYPAAAATTSIPHAEQQLTANMGSLSSCSDTSTFSYSSSSHTGMAYNGSTHTWNIPDYTQLALDTETVYLYVHIGAELIGTYSWTLENITVMNSQCSVDKDYWFTSVKVGETDYLTYTFTDADTSDSFTVTITGLTNEHYTIDDLDAGIMETVRFHPTSNALFPSVTVTLTVTDDNSVEGVNDVESCSLVFTFSVETLNHEPQITEFDSNVYTLASILVGDTFSYLIPTPTDEDGDTFTISCNSYIGFGAGYADFTQAGDLSTLILSPSSNTHVVSNIFTFYVTDSNSVNDLDGANIVAFYIQVTILALNFPPVLVFTSLPDLYLQVGVNFATVILPGFSDPDAEDTHSLTFSADDPTYTEFTFNTYLPKVTPTYIEALIQPFDNSHAGTFRFTYQVTDDNSYKASNGVKFAAMSFNVFVFAYNHAPVVLPFPLGSIQLAVQETYEIFFEVKDEDPEDVHFIWVYEMVDGEEVQAPSFVTVSLESLSLTIQPLSSFQEGDYTLLLRIEDTDSVGEGVTKYHEDFIELKITYTPPEDVVGVETKTEEENQREEAAVGKGTFKAEISRISEKGILTIAFQKPITASVNAQNMTENDIFINLSSQYPDLQADNQLLGWSFVKMNSNQLVIQLHFKDLTKISPYQQLDSLEVTFLNPVLFISQDGEDLIETNKKLSRNIPPQRQEGFEFLGEGTASDAIAGVLGVSVSISFLINFLLNASVSMIWTMMNSLQIIVHIPLVNLSFPNNCMRTSLFFTAIANFDVIPHSKLNNRIFNFELYEVSTPVRFQALGFETYNFVRNAGTTLWLIILWVIFTILTFLMSCFKNIKKIDILLNKIRLFLFFGAIIRIFLECYIELALSGFLNLKCILFNFSGESFGSIAAIVILMIVFSAPFILNYYITTRRRYLDNLSVLHKFQETYAGLRKDSKKALMYNSYFLMRRLIYVTSLVFLDDFPFTQIALLMVCSYTVILYTIAIKPFQLQFSNYMEVINESTILTLSYLTFCFSDFIPAIETKNEIGLTYSFIILLLVAFNILGILIVTFIFPFMKRTRMYLKRQRSWKRNWQKKRIAKIGQVNQTEVALHISTKDKAVEIPFTGIINRKHFSMNNSLRIKTQKKKLLKRQLKASQFIKIPEGLKESPQDNLPYDFIGDVDRSKNTSLFRARFAKKSFIGLLYEH